MITNGRSNSMGVITFENKPLSAKGGSAMSCLMLGKGGKVLVCLVTLVAFLFNTVSYDLAWAARTPLEPTAVGSSRAGGPDSPGFIKELRADTFTLPEYLGHIKDSWSPPERGTHNAVRSTIIHIQDAHCNYAAQQKISEIIGYLSKEYGVDTVNLEGGAKDYDLSVFTDITDKSIREKTADYFVQEGLVNGAEYFAINNPEKTTLWGIEDTKLYIDNLNVYRDSLKYKDEVDKHLKSLTHILNNLKTKIYSQELLKFDSKYSQYKAGSLEFKDYLAYLIDAAKNRAIDVKGFANIYLLSRTLEEETNVAFKKANNQRDDLIDKLQKRLSKNALEGLVLKTVEFRSEKISQKDFYAYLADRANFVGIDLKEFPDLQRYIVYISMYNAIDKMKVMEEMDKLENAIKDSLYQNDKQKELDKLSKNLAILKNIFNISLTKEDYKYYLDNEGSFNVSNYAVFINKEAPLYKITARLDNNVSDLNRYRENISKFYEYSFKRDDVFLKNIRFPAPAWTSRTPSLRVPPKAGRSNLKNTAILITGGFHTDNLCEILKKQNIAYISIMPNFKNGDGYESPYFNILAGKLTPIESKISALFSSTLAIPDLFNQISTLAYDSKQLAALKFHIYWVLSGRKALLLKHGDEILGAIDPKGNVYTKDNLPAINFETVFATQFTPSLQLAAPEKIATSQQSITAPVAIPATNLATAPASESFLKKYSAHIYIFSTIVATLFMAAIFSTFIGWSKSNIFVAVVQLLCMTIVNYNIVEGLAARALIFTKPLILPEVTIKGGIPQEFKTITYYPVLLRSENELMFFDESLIPSIENNDDLNIKWIIFSTSPDGIRELERARILELQKKYGRDRIFYIHRDASMNNWEKKRGGYMHFMLWLKNSLRADGTLDKDPRFPACPTGKVFDEIIGDISALKDTKNLAMADSDTIWTKDSIRKMVAKIEHPANKEYGMFQSMIDPYDISGTIFVKINAVITKIFRDRRQKFWRAVKQVNFLGHGAGWNIDRFLNDTAGNIKDGYLSHDIIESIFLKTALMEDIVTLEEIPPNLFLQVKQWARWWIGNKLSFVFFRKEVPDESGELVKNPATFVNKYLVFVSAKTYMTAPFFLVFILSQMLLSQHIFYGSTGLLGIVYVGLVGFELYSSMIFGNKNVKGTIKSEFVKSFPLFLLLTPINAVEVSILVARPYIDDIKNKIWKTEKRQEWAPQGGLAKDITLKQGYSNLKYTMLFAIASMCIYHSHMSTMLYYFFGALLISPITVWYTSRAPSPEGARFSPGRVTKFAAASLTLLILFTPGVLAQPLTQPIPTTQTAYLAGQAEKIRNEIIAKKFQPFLPSGSGRESYILYDHIKDDGYRGPLEGRYSRPEGFAYQVKMLYMTIKGRASFSDFTSENARKELLGLIKYLNRNKDKSGFLPLYVLYGDIGHSEVRIDQEGKINMLDNAFLLLDLLSAYGGLCDSKNETDKAIAKEIELFINDLKWNLVFDEKTGLFPQHYYPGRPFEQRFNKAEGELKEVYSEGFLAYLAGYLLGGLDIRWNDLEQGAILNESPDGTFRWIPKTKHGALYQMPLFLYFDRTLNDALFKANQNLVDASLRISAQRNYPLPPLPSPTPGSDSYRYSIGGLNDLAADAVDESFSSPVGATGFVEAVYPGKGLSLLGEVRRSIGSIPDSYTIRDGKVVPSLWSATDNAFFMTGGLYSREVRSDILTALKRLPQGQKRYEQLQGILNKVITFEAVPSEDEVRKLKITVENKNVSIVSLLTKDRVQFAFPMNIPEAHSMTGENKLTINYRDPADKWGGYGIKFIAPQDMKGKWINISYTANRETYIKCELKKGRAGGGEITAGQNQKVLLNKTASGQTVSFLVPENDSFENISVITLIVETDRLSAEDANVTINIRDVSMSDKPAGKRSGGINKHVPGNNYYATEQIEEIDAIISAAEQAGNARSITQGHQKIADLIDRVAQIEREEDLRRFIIDTIGDTPLAERFAKKLFAIRGELINLSRQLRMERGNLHVNGRGLKLKEVKSGDIGFYPRHNKGGSALVKDNALPIFDRIPAGSQTLYITEGFKNEYSDEAPGGNVFAQTILHSMLEYFFDIDHQDSSAMEILFNGEEKPASKGLQTISDTQKEYLSIAAGKKLADYFPALFGAHEYDINDSFRIAAVLEYTHAMENSGLGSDTINYNLRVNLAPHMGEEGFIRKLFKTDNESLKAVIGNLTGDAPVPGAAGLGGITPEKGQPGSLPMEKDGLCLTPDSLIHLADGALRPLIKLKAGDMVLSLNEETRNLEPHRVNALLDMGIKPVYEITTAGGKTLKTTLNHPYLTKDGWKKLKDIKAGEEIAAANTGLSSAIGVFAGINSVNDDIISFNIKTNTELPDPESMRSGGKINQGFGKMQGVFGRDIQFNLFNNAFPQLPGEFPEFSFSRAGKFNVLNHRLIQDNPSLCLISSNGTNPNFLASSMPFLSLSANLGLTGRWVSMASISQPIGLWNTYSLDEADCSNFSSKAQSMSHNEYVSNTKYFGEPFLSSITPALKSLEKASPDFLISAGIFANLSNVSNLTCSFVDSFANDLDFIFLSPSSFLLPPTYFPRTIYHAFKSLSISIFVPKDIKTDDEVAVAAEEKPKLSCHSDSGLAFFANAGFGLGNYREGFTENLGFISGEKRKKQGGRIFNSCVLYFYQDNSRVRADREMEDVAEVGIKGNENTIFFDTKADDFFIAKPGKTPLKDGTDFVTRVPDDFYGSNEEAFVGKEFHLCRFFNENILVFNNPYGIMNSGLDIFAGKLGITIGNDTFNGIVGFKKFQNHVDRYPRSLNTRLAKTDLGVNRDSFLKRIISHYLRLQIELYHKIIDASSSLVSRNAYAAQTPDTLSASDILWDRIISIEPLGKRRVYDIEVEGTHNFVAQGIVAHNTYTSAGSPAKGDASDMLRARLNLIRSDLRVLLQKRERGITISDKLKPKFDELTQRIFDAQEKAAGDDIVKVDVSDMDIGSLGLTLKDIPILGIMGMGGITPKPEFKSTIIIEDNAIVKMIEDMTTLEGVFVCTALRTKADDERIGSYMQPDAVRKGLKDGTILAVAVYDTSAEPGKKAIKQFYMPPVSVPGKDEKEQSEPVQKPEEDSRNEEERKVAALEEAKLIVKNIRESIREIINRIPGLVEGDIILASGIPAIEALKTREDLLSEKGISRKSVENFKKQLVNMYKEIDQILRYAASNYRERLGVDKAADIGTITNAYMENMKRFSPAEHEGKRSSKMADKIRELLIAAYRELMKGKESAGAQNPFRFPDYIWQEFKTLIQSNAALSGYYELIKTNGLAWTDAAGKIHYIDEKLDSETAKQVWILAKTAVERALGHEIDISVKNVIEYHESIHAKFRDQKFKELIDAFKKKLEEIYPGIPLGEDHPFIKSFIKTYGRPHGSESLAGAEAIGWYIEEFIALSMQEAEFFNDPDAVINRMAISEEIINQIKPVLHTDTIAEFEASIKVAAEAAKADAGMGGITPGADFAGRTEGKNWDKIEQIMRDAGHGEQFIKDQKNKYGHLDFEIIEKPVEELIKTLHPNNLKMMKKLMADEKVLSYADKTTEPPAIVVVNIDSKDKIIDGYKRLAATKKNGEKYVKAFLAVTQPADSPMQDKIGQFVNAMENMSAKSGDGALVSPDAASFIDEKLRNILGLPKEDTDFMVKIVQDSLQGGSLTEEIKDFVNKAKEELDKNKAGFALVEYDNVLNSLNKLKNLVSEQEMRDEHQLPSTTVTSGPDFTGKIEPSPSPILSASAMIDVVVGEQAKETLQKPETLEIVVKLEKSLPQNSRWKNMSEVEETLSRSDNDWFVAMKDGQFIGYALYNRKLGALSRLVVTPQQMGYGTRLLDQVLENLSASGIEKIKIFPTSDSETFYRTYFNRGADWKIQEQEGGFNKIGLLAVKQSPTSSATKVEYYKIDPTGQQIGLGEPKMMDIDKKGAGIEVEKGDVAIVVLGQEDTQKPLSISTNKVESCTAVAFKGTDREGRLVLGLAHIPQGTSLKQGSGAKELSHRIITALLNNMQSRDFRGVSLFIRYNPFSAEKIEEIFQGNNYKDMLEKLEIIKRVDEISEETKISELKNHDLSVSRNMIEIKEYSPGVLPVAKDTKTISWDKLSDIKSRSLGAIGMDGITPGADMIGCSQENLIKLIDKYLLRADKTLDAGKIKMAEELKEKLKEANDLQSIVNVLKYYSAKPTPQQEKILRDIKAEISDFDNEAILFTDSSSLLGDMLLIEAKTGGVSLRLTGERRNIQVTFINKNIDTVLDIVSALSHEHWHKYDNLTLHKGLEYLIGEGFTTFLEGETVEKILHSNSKIARSIIEEQNFSQQDIGMAFKKLIVPRLNYKIELGFVQTLVKELGRDTVMAMYTTGSLSLLQERLGERFTFLSDIFDIALPYNMSFDIDFHSAYIQSKVEKIRLMKAIVANKSFNKDMFSASKELLETLCAILSNDEIYKKVLRREKSHQIAEILVREFLYKIMKADLIKKYRDDLISNKIDYSGLESFLTQEVNAIRDNFLKVKGSVSPGATSLPEEPIRAKASGRITSELISDTMSRTVFEAVRVESLSNAGNWGLDDLLEALKASTLPNMNRNLFDGKPAAIAIGVTEEEWNIYQNRLGMEAAGIRHAVQHYQLGNIAIMFFKDSGDGREELQSKLKSEDLKISPERVITFTRSETGQTESDKLLRESSCPIFLKTQNLEGAQDVTPVAACFRTGLAALNILDQEKIEGADRTDAIREFTDSIVTLSGESFEPDAIEDIAKDIQKRGLANIIILISIRPVNVNELDEYNDSMIKVLQSL